MAVHKDSMHITSTKLGCKHPFQSVVYSSVSYLAAAVVAVDKQANTSNHQVAAYIITTLVIGIFIGGPHIRRALGGWPPDDGIGGSSGGGGGGWSGFLDWWETLVPKGLRPRRLVTVHEQWPTQQNRKGSFLDGDPGLPRAGSRSSIVTDTLGSGDGVTDPSTLFTTNGVGVNLPPLEKLASITQYSGFYSKVGVNFNSFMVESGATFVSGELSLLKPATVVALQSTFEAVKSLS